jgi:magnesium-protoporphyrin O-methyltransferase
MDISTCCHCQGADDFFSDRRARKELKKYRRKGPDKSTRLLLEGIVSRGVEGASVLDIGGGVGVIQHELAARGAAEIYSADASQAYLATSRAEAEERGYAERARYLLGDFVEIAPDVEEVDIVTLDRVVCCYPDMPTLVEASASKARRVYGLVFPRDRWPVRAVIAGINLMNALRRSSFRVFVRPPEEIDRTVRAAGFEPRYSALTFVWHVAVYAR